METKIITLEPPYPYQSKMIYDMMRMYRKSIGYGSWLRSRVSDLEESMRKTGALCLVQLEKEKVIGFAQGYKVSTDHYVDGLGTIDMPEGEYFLVERIAINPYAQEGFSGERLMQQILETLPRQEILFCIKKERSPVFELIADAGGEVKWPFRQDVFAFMQISTKM